MAKKFYKRSILKPEKSLEEEKWEKDEERKLSTKNIKTPTSVFDGINENRHTKAMEKSILLDISQEGREEDDDWVEERN